MRLRSFLLALFVPSLAAAAPPARVVSLNLCADQYVVALADRAQIVGLSRNARDPAMSFAAPAARGLPVVRGGAEQVLLMRPDVVIGAPFSQRALLAPLARRGTRLIDMPPENGLADVEATIRLVAETVGHPDRGAALIARIRRRLAAVDARAGRGRIAAYYQRRGYLTGTGTLVDGMMARVGLRNLARVAGLPPLAQLSLERMALARPDLLILESATRRVADQGTEMLHHPLLDRVVPPDRRIWIPEALTVCGGPAYPVAVELLARRLRAMDAPGRASTRAVIPARAGIH